MQVVFRPETFAAAHEAAQHLRTEYCVRVRGAVRARPEGTSNAMLPTGAIEVAVDEVEVLSAADTPPFQVDDYAEADEMLRLQYRYVDLRRPSMQHKLKLRHAIVAAIRRFLDGEGFVEIDTSILTLATLDGALDFLVPARLLLGYFY